MVTVYVKEDGLDETIRFINAVAARGVNTEPLMGIIGHLILSSVTRNFEAEGRPEKWKPVSQFTKDIYSGKALERLTQSKGYLRLRKSETRKKWESSALGKISDKVLQQSGHLRKSIHIGKVTNTSVEVGSSLDYARIHQLGGEIRPKNKKALLIPLGDGKHLQVKKVTIPARPYLVLQDEDGYTIRKATGDYLLKGGSRAGG